MKKKFSFIALSLLGLALTACGGTDTVGLHVDEEDMAIDTEWVEYSVPITKVSFDQGEDSIVIERDQEYTYSYSIEPAKAVKRSLIWESSNEDVCTVSNGVVKGVGAGKAMVYVSNAVGSFTSISLNVEVIIPIKDFAFKESTFYADLHNEYQLEVEYNPYDTTEKGVTWAIENENIASISESGVLTTKGVTGVTHVTASSAYLNKIISLTVDVADRTVYPDAVSITESVEEVEVGKGFTMKAVSSKGGDTEIVTHKEVKYYSTDSSILSVEEDTGVVYALGTGTAEIYATAQGATGPVSSAHKEVTVFEVLVDEILLEDITLSNRNGRSDIAVPFTYTTNKDGYEKASIPNFVYEVEDTSVATVNDNGKIFAVAATGSTTLTVRETRSGESKTVNLTVGYEIDTMTVSGTSELTIGGSTQLSVSTTPSGVPSELFSFSSSDSTVASVSESGLVTAEAAGTAVITVSAFGKSKDFSVTVKNPLPQHQYYVEGIGGDWSIHEEYALSLDLGDPEANHYYLGPIHLTANTEIKVYDYHNNVFIGSTEGYTDKPAYWKTISGGNLLVLIEDDYYIDFYVNAQNDNHLKLYHNGSEDDPVLDQQYYIKGIGGDWSLNEKYAMNADAEDDNHYYYGPIQLPANTEVKVYDLINDIWYGSNEGYTEQPTYWTTVAGGNIKTLVEGNFYIDLSVDHGGGNHIKFYYDGEEPQPGLEYFYSVNGGEFVKMSAGEGSEVESESVSFAKGDVLTFKKDSAAYAVTPKDSGQQTKVYAVEGGVKFAEAYTGKLYLDTSTGALWAGQFTPGYYLAGIGGEWEPKLATPAPKVGPDDPAYVVENVVLEAGAELKFINFPEEGNTVTWYKAQEGKVYSSTSVAFTIVVSADSSDGNLKVTNAGTYNIYFNPSDGSYSIEDQNYVPDVPATDGYYLVGTKSNWKFDGATKLGAGTGDNKAELLDYSASAHEEFRIRGYHSKTDTWYEIDGIGAANYVVGDSAKQLDIIINNAGVVIVTEHGVTPSTEKTFYFTCPGAWTDLHVYYFGASGEVEPWPGVSMTPAGTNQYGEYVYSITFDTAVYTTIVFNSYSQGWQTRDIPISDFGSHNACYVDGNAQMSGAAVGFWTK